MTDPASQIACSAVHEELFAAEGALVTRESHPPSQDIGAHHHDWPTLLVPLAGGFTSHVAERRTWLSGPSALMHPSRRDHGARIGDRGLVAIVIHFDPVWLSRKAEDLQFEAHRILDGGASGAAAQRLAGFCLAGRIEASALAARMADVLRRRSIVRERRRPPWLGLMRAELSATLHGSAGQFAKRFALHPAWVAQAYRSEFGEGIQQAVRRARVERATAMLWSTGCSLSDVAAASGFFDQSHMNRCFQAVIGRTPGEIRRDYQASTLWPLYGSRGGQLTGR